MENFVFHAPTEIYFGKDKMEKLPDILSRYGKCSSSLWWWKYKEKWNL